MSHHVTSVKLDDARSYAKIITASPLRADMGGSPHNRPARG